MLDKAAIHIVIICGKFIINVFLIWQRILESRDEVGSLEKQSHVEINDLRRGTRK